ncbi:hypothetical protein GW17_00014781 [Ensete ventricosum]|nr:hypothetical protein GW17_00014781 [Ensete ventricosum]
MYDAGELILWRPTTFAVGTCHVKKSRVRRGSMRPFSEPGNDPTAGNGSDADRRNKSDRSDTLVLARFPTVQISSSGSRTAQDLARSPRR